MLEPRVSVLITFYNQENYVDKALKSVLDQKTKFGVKILVGDDGSTDNTCNNVKKWIDKFPDRISLYLMEREDKPCIGGFRASQNRLNLLKHVDTDYFIYLDGDDYFDFNEKLQKQVDILDDEANKDCVCCGHNIDMIYLDGKRVPICSLDLKEGKYSPKEYWKKYYFHTDTLLIRNSIIPSVPFELVENNFNDNMITYIAIQHGNLYYIPQSWAVYLQTGDGIWTSNKKIINNIRNMFIFDLCNQINNKMKMQTSVRFSQAWMILLQNRKDINANELEAFGNEAEEKKLLNSYKWIHFSELSFFKKNIMVIKAFSICWKNLLRDYIK